jgi:hypothetical protein
MAQPAGTNKSKEAAFETRLLDLADNDISIYKLEPDPTERTLLPGQKVYTCFPILIEFDESMFIYHPDYLIINFRTTKGNLFLKNEFERLLTIGLPGYTIDKRAMNAPLESAKQSMGRGYGFHKNHKATLVSMNEHSDGNISLTVVQYPYYTSIDNLGKVGYMSYGPGNENVPLSDLEVIPHQFDAADTFSGELALVNIGGKNKKYNKRSDDTKGGKWAFINRKGEIVIPFTASDKAPEMRDGKGYFITKGVTTVVGRTAK